MAKRAGTKASDGGDAPVASATEEEDEAAPYEVRGRYLAVYQIDVWLVRSLLALMLDEGRRRGFLEASAPASPGGAGEAEDRDLRRLLARLLGGGWSMGAELKISSADFDWVEHVVHLHDICDLLAIAAVPGSRVLVLDSSAYSLDLFEVIFDGAGKYRQDFVVKRGEVVMRPGTPFSQPRWPGTAA